MYRINTFPCPIVFVQSTPSRASAHAYRYGMKKRLAILRLPPGTADGTCTIHSFDASESLFLSAFFTTGFHGIVNIITAVRQLQVRPMINVRLIAPTTTPNTGSRYSGGVILLMLVISRVISSFNRRGISRFWKPCMMWWLNMALEAGMVIVLDLEISIILDYRGNVQRETYDPSEDVKKARPFAREWSFSGKSTWQGTTFARTKIPTPSPVTTCRPERYKASTFWSILEVRTIPTTNKTPPTRKKGL